MENLFGGKEFLTDPRADTRDRLAFILSSRRLNRAQQGKPVSWRVRSDQILHLLIAYCINKQYASARGSLYESAVRPGLKAIAKGPSRRFWLLAGATPGAGQMQITCARELVLTDHMAPLRNLLGNLVAG